MAMLSVIWCIVNILNRRFFPSDDHQISDQQNVLKRSCVSGGATWELMEHYSALGPTCTCVSVHFVPSKHYIVKFLWKYCGNCDGDHRANPTGQLLSWWVALYMGSG